MRDSLEEFWEKEWQTAVDTYGTRTITMSQDLRCNKYIDHIQKRCFQKLFDKFIPKNEGKKALDIGTGVGRWARYVHAKGYITTGIDVSEAAIKLTKLKGENQGLSFMRMSCEKMGFADETFDLITSVTVLEHLTHIRQKSAISEICRVLKRGGYILIIELIDTSDRAKHVFPYDIDAYIKMFNEYGCKPLGMLGLDYSLLLRGRLLNRLLNLSPEFKKLMMPLSYLIELVCINLQPNIIKPRHMGIVFRKQE